MGEVVYYGRGCTFKKSARSGESILCGKQMEIRKVNGNSIDLPCSDKIDLESTNIGSSASTKLPSATLDIGSQSSLVFSKRLFCILVHYHWSPRKQSTSYLLPATNTDNRTSLQSKAIFNKTRDEVIYPFTLEPGLEICW